MRTLALARWISVHAQLLAITLRLKLLRGDRRRAAAERIKRNYCCRDRHLWIRCKLTGLHHGQHGLELYGKRCGLCGENDADGQDVRNHAALGQWMRRGR